MAHRLPNNAQAMQYEDYLPSEIAELKKMDERRARRDAAKRELKNLKKRNDRALLKFGKMTFAFYRVWLDSRGDRKKKNAIARRVAERESVAELMSVEQVGRIFQNLKRSNACEDLSEYLSTTDTDGS